MLDESGLFRCKLIEASDAGILGITTTANWTRNPRRGYAREEAAPSAQEASEGSLRRQLPAGPRSCDPAISPDLSILRIAKD